MPATDVAAAAPAPHTSALRPVSSIGAHGAVGRQQREAWPRGVDHLACFGYQPSGTGPRVASVLRALNTGTSPEVVVQSGHEPPVCRLS